MTSLERWRLLDPESLSLPFDFGGTGAPGGDLGHGVDGNVRRWMEGRGRVSGGRLWCLREYAAI